LSPKENREKPPLDYDIVADLKRARPDLEIILNGGLADLDMADAELRRVDGVMLGRAAYHEPALLLEVDRRFFGDAAPARTPDEAALEFRPWILQRLGEGVPLHAIVRHMLGLFAGRPGARQWRRILSEGAPRATGLKAIGIYDAALSAVAPAAGEVIAG
jgi:tRNA-dihydrouridine synthase A